MIRKQTRYQKDHGKTRSQVLVKSHLMEPEEVEARVSAALPAADTPEFIGVPETGEPEAEVPEGYFQRRWYGKQSIKRQIRKFLITGWCKWRVKRIESRAELAHTFDQQIISEMERTVKEWKTYWAKRTRPVELGKSAKIGNTVQLKYALYNPGSAQGERLQEIIQQFSWCDVIIIPATRMSRRKAPKEGEMKATGVRAQYDSQCGRFIQISWGYDGKDRMAGLMMLLSKKRFSADNIVRYYDPPVALAGRWGAVRVKNEGNMDLFIAGCYAYVEGDERGTKLWDHISTVLAAVRARTTIVMAGDFNGHVEAGEGPNGPLHPAESTNENGEKIISVCTTHNLTLVNTWKASAADQTEWNGETHVGPQGTKQRVDYFAVSEHAFEEVEQVKAQIKAAMRLRPGGVKPGKELFDHIPLTMVHRYKLAVKKTRKSETTKWHFARLKHAMDDPEAERQFRIDLQQWVMTEGQNIRLKLMEQNVEQAWLPLAQGIYRLARKHFATRKGPREQWLSENTWEMMRKRTWLVDSLWKEADIAEVSAEVVRLTKQIRKSCRQDKRNRIDKLCEEMEEASRNRDGKKVWECARAVAGTGLGLKRRVFQPPDEVPITAQEWDEYMKDTFRAQLSSPLGPQPSKGCVRGQLPPRHEFFNTIEYSKNNKTVADGDVPNEVWKLIIRDRSAGQIIYELFQQSLREGVNPAAFCTSPLAPIDKGNNKKGCKSKRPISICNSLGKQFHRTLYRHHVKDLAPPWSFGNVKGRRREESCLIVRLCMARCRRAKRSCAYTGCFFGIGALVFEKVLSCETRGPILRNRGLSSETLFH